MPRMAHKIWTMLLLCSVPLQLHGAEAASYSTYWHEGLGREMLVATVDGQDYWITDDEDLGADFPLSEMVMINIEEQGDFDADGFQDVLSLPMRVEAHQSPDITSPHTWDTASFTCPQ